jgi:hypothetical protein
VVLHVPRSDTARSPGRGFLPPNNPAHIGEGSVRYTINPKSNLTTGDDILAFARIVFDTNAHIDTPPFHNIIDITRPTSSVNALLAARPESFDVSWSGSDGLGSGIASYTVYVSDNDGDYTAWLTDTTATSATFTGVIGHSYKFYTVATDNLGHVEEAPPSHDTSTLIVVVGSASQLVFGTPPLTYATKASSNPFTVSVGDANGSIVDSNTSTITLTVVNAPKGARVTGILSVAAINGVASFNNLIFSKTGAYILKATSPNLTEATSSTFTVFAPAVKLAFKQQPTTTIAGNTIGPAITISVLDAAGKLVTTDTSTVTIALATIVPGATLSGTLTAPVINGIATFTNLMLTKAASYTLLATDGALKSIKSKSFTITPETASAHLVLSTPSNTTPVGKNLLPAIKVTVMDQYNNIVTTDKSTVSLSILSGPTGGSLTGTLSAKVTKGVATFAKAALTMGGTYTLALNDSALAITTAVQISQTITPVASTISVSKVAKSYLNTVPVTFTATVKSSAPASVVFQGIATVVDANNTVLGSVTLTSAGVGNFSITNLTAGTYTCRVLFAGDVSHNAATSSAFTLVIKA